MFAMTDVVVPSLRASLTVEDLILPEQILWLDVSLYHFNYLLVHYLFVFVIFLISSPQSIIIRCHEFLSFALATLSYWIGESHHPNLSLTDRSGTECSFPPFVLA
jgi:hypothetical protein